VHLRLPLVVLLAATVVVVACRKPEAVPDAGTPEPTAAELESAARRTAERLGKEAARWTARHAFGGGRTLEVEILQAPDGRRRMRFTAVGLDGGKATLAQIVQKDGHWYVTEGDVSAVYRPYQAPLQLPALYLYLARSELQLFDAQGHGALGTHTGVEKGVARYRAALPEEMQAQLNALAGSADAADAGAVGAEVRSVVSNGLQTHIDVEHGVVLRAGMPGAETELDGPHFLASLPEEASFDTGDLVPSLLAAPIQSVTESLVMLAHCGAWRPGAPGCELDTHLLELKSGALRRVPYAGGTSLPGAFLPGRTRVVVSGTDVAGGMRPFEVDLLSGAQRPLGGDALARGISLFPTLSPDGSTLALTWLPRPDARAEARVMLVDVEGGEARALGTALEHSHLQWLPDGSGLLLVVQTAQADAGVPERALARLSLDGTLERLRVGDQPLVLDAQSLLYFDRESGGWMRGKLDGSGARRFGTGHPTLAHPTLSPDGAQLVFLQRGEDGSMAPVQVDLAGRTVSPVMPEPGLWAWPRWR
jgi:hypothetical protein